MNKQRRLQISMCSDKIEDVMQCLGNIQREELEDDDAAEYIVLVGGAYRDLQDAVDKLTHIIVDHVRKTSRY